MKILPKRRVLMALGLTVPVAIFFAARSAASWRPRLVAKQNNVYGAELRGSHFLHLSPDEKWLVSEDDYQKTSTLWNLADTRQKRTIPGTEAVFSSDSRFVATTAFEAEKIYFNDLRALLWSKKLPRWDSDVPVRFAANNTALQYHDAGPSLEGSTVTLALKDGKVLSTKESEASSWDTESVMAKDESTVEKTKVSFYPEGADKPVYSFETSNGDDRWELAPDGAHLWVSLAKQHRFDIRDAKIGRVLWSYSAQDTNVNSDGSPADFSCYPLWEGGGKTLATIEANTLTVRDAQTGKVLVHHKNNLPASLKSWALTKDGNTAYLMDAQGRIFRQQLS